MNLFKHSISDLISTRFSDPAFSGFTEEELWESFCVERIRELCEAGKRFAEWDCYSTEIHSKGVSRVYGTVTHSFEVKLNCKGIQLGLTVSAGLSEERKPSRVLVTLSEHTPEPYPVLISQKVISHVSLSIRDTWDPLSTVNTLMDRAYKVFTP